MNRLNLMQGLMIGLGLATAASAQASITGANGVNFTEAFLGAGFTGSITLSAANNPHVLSGDIWIRDGATLTIEAGVTFRSTLNSTLFINRGAQIFANGTKDAPITFTSSSDTGVYRQQANNEWGNLTIMGAGYISEDEIPTNTAVPSSTNFANMEGATPPAANPEFDDYGGGNDNDDSGTLSHCTFSYGGIASIPGDELNGLSLGGIGRNTDIHHVEIVNNIDDGIEIWGGTVNLKYVSIWNIGDDSFDVDQGWRGKAQFGLIVQGCGGTGGQGSGFGDNGMEIDGAERCDWQPVTTAAIHNFTVIGGEADDGSATNGNPTDELVEFRDNSRVQFLNCIFMDAGKNSLLDKISDEEVNNTLALCGGPTVPQLLARMQTSAGSTYATNAFPGAPELTPGQAYTAQNSAGNLVEFRGCCYFNNDSDVNAANFGVFGGVAGTNHANNTILTTSPVTTLTRSATACLSPSHSTFPVTFLDPTPTAVAQTAVEVSPNDGFYRQARYCGAFARGNNWLIGWSFTSRNGLTSSSQANVPIHGVEKPGAVGAPVHFTVGDWSVGNTPMLGVDNVQDFGLGPIALVIVGLSPLNPADPCAGLNIGPFTGFDNILIPNGDLITVAQGAPGSDEVMVPFATIPAGLGGTVLYTQAVGFDTGVPAGQFTTSNAQRHTLP